MRPDHIELVQRILRQHVPGAEVLAFGSRAKWLARDTSDLDLCIRAPFALSFEQMGTLREAFEESNLPYMVDLVDWATTSESFRKIIERDRVVVQKTPFPQCRLDAVGLAGEWAEVPLGDVITLQRGFDLPSQKRKPGKVPIVSSSGVSDYNSEVGVKGPGVVTGRYGTIGQVFLIKEDFWPLNTTLWVKNFHGNDPHFASYLLRTIDFRSCSDKSSVPGVNRNDLHRIPVLRPPLAEQKSIALILGTLDDKIELNRRMNKTLEAIARALFKSWFVDFEPVRAKIDARWQSGDSLPGLPAHLCELFPSRLVDSELGEIPEGWEVKPLDEIAAFINGLALQKFSATDLADSLPVIKIAELRNGVSHKSDRASRDVPEKYIIKDGDFLFSWSGSLLAKFWTEGEGALNQHLFKVTSEQYPMWFVSHWVHHHLEEFQSIAASKATTMGHIQRGHLKSAMTVCPDQDTLKKFDCVMAPLIDEAIHNELESRSLAALRDTLLPKLVSGELRVIDAARITGAVI
ncbi:Type I restriction-modification system, specificity subunit S [Oxalobacteraceae bacterium IMCC9480]|nr:Type I restriction-modification system, specificity subunit S [Oxalobacteraceae bacterium IMCC9480]